MKTSSETLIYADLSAKGSQFTARAASGSMSVYKVTWPVGSPSVKTEGFQMGVAVKWWSAFNTLPQQVREALKAEAEKADRLSVLEKVLQATEEYKRELRPPGGSDLHMLIQQSYNEALADIARVLETGELKQ